MYTCPMHPEMRQKKPGHCPKCGMELLLENELSGKASTRLQSPKAIADGGQAQLAKSHVSHSMPSNSSGIHHDDKASLTDYLPLVVVIGIILLTTLTLSYRDLNLGSFQLTQSISYFMIGFFLTFSSFKLMDLKGFAQGYFTYDLLAKRWFGYGYIYPFIELFFGLSMILVSENKLLLWAEFAIMAFSGLGVAIKLAKKEKFQCSCLGTFLKVPLTKVTLIEDFGMAFLALLMIFLP